MTVQIALTKEVPLYYYKCIRTRYTNGEYFMEKEHYFKSTKKMAHITEKDVVKALKIKKGQEDCIWWEQIKPDKFFNNMVEV